MKLHCHRSSLVTAFQVVGAVVPTRTPKDILKNVKLQATDGTATLTGTDQEIGIRYEIPGVESESDGEVLLPAAHLLSILRELSDEHVDLELVDGGFWVRAGHSEFRLPTPDAEEFPPVPSFTDENYLLISGRSLREAVRRTVFATDVESTRYALGGVLLELESEALTMVATDSRRLAVVRNSCRTEGTAELANDRPVVPSKALSLAERSISDDEAEVFVAVHANDVVIKTGNSTISSRLVDGRFPNYRQVIPAESRLTIALVVEPFYSAVRKAQLVTDNDSRGVDFCFTSGLLTLNSQSADIGQSKVELPIGYDGDDLIITFDPRFVAEFLRVLEPETSIRLELIDDESAAVFRVDESYTYVIMPLSRTQRDSRP